MIAYAMLYTAAVGVPVFLAAWAVAAVLRRYGRPERGVWLVGLVLGFALPLLGLMGGLPPDAASGSTATRGTGTGVIGLPEIVVIPEGAARAGVFELLAVLWIAASALLAVRFAVAALRLARASRAWRPGTMDGISVWLTDDMGPAVSGLVHPRVLVPAWLAEMPAPRRSLVLLHEQEHIRAGDGWLMLVSRLAPIVAPWNPVVWMLSSRLLRAIELDCDRRVLRHRPDVRAYGTTLIEISSRDSGRLVAVAAFAESEAPLRSRILSMTTPSRAVSLMALFTAMVFGVVLMIAAFEIPVPTIRADLQIGPDPASAAVVDAPEGEDDRPADAEAALPPDDEIERQPIAALSPDGRSIAFLGPNGRASLADAPRFTPFTVAPRLLNVPRVQQALVQEYPSELRDVGIGGRVLVWFLIDEEGLVERTLINQSSGHDALDQAALAVADIYRFSPALNRDQRVPVWVALPITFQVR